MTKTRQHAKRQSFPTTRRLQCTHNADDVLYAIVQLVNEIGNVEIMEKVDHKPAPEPTPEPEEEPVEE